MRPWTILAAIAGALALRTLYEWALVVASGVPTGYGEGAVAHAGQILARGGDPYGAVARGAFVSANYPPLAYVVEAIGEGLGPFTALRVVNVLACVAVAFAAAWRARADRAVAVALGASFLAMFPVAAWASGARVDPLAVALAGLAVLVASRDPRRAALAGALAVLAVTAKPTAVVPLAAVFGFLLWRERATAARVGVASAVALTVAAALILARFDAAGVWEHLVTYNAFPYDLRNPLLLAVVGVLTIGAYVGVAFRVADGRMRAYLAGAAGVVLLGGHEGATINYLLDLAAAACVALAPLARVPSPRVAALFAGQLVATVILTTLGPFGATSLSVDRARVDVARAAAQTGPVHAEDSGLIVAAGVEPLIDDQYVWARLVAIGARTDDLTPRVRAAEFAAILSDIALDRVADGTLVERQRWPDALVAAVLERYRLDRHEATVWVYVPR